MIYRQWEPIETFETAGITFIEPTLQGFIIFSVFFITNLNDSEAALFISVTNVFSNNLHFAV